MIKKNYLHKFISNEILFNNNINIPVLKMYFLKKCISIIYIINLKEIIMYKIYYFIK